MTILSSEALRASREFLEATARPLELARFRHAFLGAPTDMVLDALGPFQNDDGGFGHALEPDLRTPASSVLCTSVALQILRSLEIPTEHAFASSSVRFLMASLDRDQWGWRIIPQAAESSPRAPWWYQRGREAHFEAFSLNPTAEILGYLFDYREHVEEEAVRGVSERVFREIGRPAGLEMHELLCCLRLFKTRSLPDTCRDQLRARLNQALPGAVAREPKEWSGYSLRPLQVADAPESPFLVGLQDAVAENLDYEIATQNRDGSWTPTWTWDDTYPEAWARAREEWSGVITLDKLLTLRRFGRIEGHG